MTWAILPMRGGNLTALFCFPYATDLSCSADGEISVSFQGKIYMNLPVSEEWNG